MAEESSPPKGSNKVLIIVAGVVAVLILLCIICSAVWYFFFRAADKAVDDAMENITEESIENAVEDAIEDGGVDFEFSGDLAAGFPDDVPIYPNSQSVYSYAEEESGYVAGFSVDGVDGGTVMDFYSDELPGKGWNITAQSDYFGTMIIAEKNTRTLSISVLSLEENMVSYSITVSNQ